MNRLLLQLAFVVPLVPVTSCALDDNASPSGLGGGFGTSGGQGTASGGATSSGGSSTSASASGGFEASGGTSSAGGTVQSGLGGASAQGGAIAGVSGAGTGSGGLASGASGGSSGSSPSGGKPASGGTSTGGAASGASAGTSTSGGGAPSVGEIVGKLDGFLGMYPCGAGDFTGYDCVNTACASGQKRVTQEFTIGGSSQAVYEIQLRVRGLVEAKNYTSACMRRAGTTMDSSTMGGDFLCTGGATQSSSYNEYSLNITGGAVTGQPTFFGLNARNGTSEAHESWGLNYTFSLRVHGGGTIRYTYFDSNCRMITNCGPGVGGSSCGSDQRILDVSNADPQPMGFQQPYLGVPQANGPGQWILLDVLAVTSAQ